MFGSPVSGAGLGASFNSSKGAWSARQPIPSESRQSDSLSPVASRTSLMADEGEEDWDLNARDQQSFFEPPSPASPVALSNSPSQSREHWSSVPRDGYDERSRSFGRSYPAEPPSASSSPQSSFHPGVTSMSPGLSTSPPSSKNTRGSRLGQQMGLAGKQNSLSPPMTEQSPANNGERSSVADDGEDSAVDRSTSSIPKYTRGGLGQLGSAFGLEDRDRDRDRVVSGASGADSTFGLSSSRSAQSAPKRLSRLQYNKPGSSSKNDEQDRAHRLAQSSLSNLSNAFRRLGPTSAETSPTDPPSARQSSSASTRDGTRHSWKRAQSSSTSDGRSDSAMTGEDDSYLESESVGPSSRWGSFSTSAGHGQKDLLLPTQSVASDTLASNQMPRFSSSDKAPRRMASAQRLRDAREDLHGTLPQLARSDVDSRQQSTSSAHARQDFSVDSSVSNANSSHLTGLSDVVTAPAYRNRGNQRTTSEQQPSTSRAQSSELSPKEVYASSLNQSSSPTANRTKPQLTDSEIVQLGALDDQAPESLLPANGAPLSSKNVLTIALAKAQSAVKYDSSNSVPEAIQAYRQAVRLLQEVMLRISPREGSSRRSTREEERRRLKVIHDTYTDRIRLLSMIYGATGTDTPADTSTSQPDDSLAVLPSNSSEPDSSQASAAALSKSFLPDVRPDRKPADDISATQIPSYERQEMMRTSDDDKRTGSDSGGSFQSAGSRAALVEAQRDHQQLHQLQPAQSNKTGKSNLTLPGSSREDDGSPLPPPTPYFDAEPTLGANNIARDDASVSLSATKVSDAEGLLAVTPTTARPNDGEGLPTPKTSVERPSPGFPRLEADLSPSGGLDIDTSAFTTESNSGALAGRSFSPLGTGSSRSRAATLLSPVQNQQQQHQPATRESGQSGASRFLVNPSVVGGSIISRRLKASGAAQEAETDTPSTASQLIPNDGTDPTPPAQPSTAANPSTQSSAPSSQDSTTSIGRRRALSQPGGKRPTLPSAFHAPALPKFARKLSNAATSPAASGSSVNNSSLQQPQPLGSAISAFQQRQLGYPSPALSSGSGYHALHESDSTGVSPAIVTSEYPWPSPVASAEADRLASTSTPKITSTAYTPSAGTSLSDLFPGGLYSAAAVGAPSIALSRPSEASRLRKVTPTAMANASPASLTQTVLSSQPPLRAFGAAKSLRNTILTGALLTRKLSISPSIWLTPHGAKLSALDTKVRMLDLVSAALDGVEKAGQPLLVPVKETAGASSTNGQVKTFVKQLDELDVLLTDVQNTLSKKLGYIDVAVGSSGGGGSGSAGLSNFGSKLTRGLDRMTHHTTGSNRNLDSPSAYVEALARIFGRSAVLEAHLVLLTSPTSADLATKEEEATTTPPTTSAYATMAPEQRTAIETRLRRSATFFGSVVLRMVLHDLALLADKSLKRTGASLLNL
ncbi:unnamed protein product [Jaminaea pallidilutea]